jgi:magnesium chelatase accessory protein
MAADLHALLERQGERPAAIVGHSAGGALALRMAQTAQTPPSAVVGLNAALDNFDGAAGILFPMMAKALALNPLVAPTMARLAQPGTVQRLIEGTGSRLDDKGLALYRACISDARHVDGTLTMMAQWRLERLRSALPRTEIPALLMAGEGDRAVSPETSERAARRLPLGEVALLPRLGHLAHEEAPEDVAERIDAFLARHL